MLSRCGGGGHGGKQGSVQPASPAGAQAVDGHVAPLWPAIAPGPHTTSRAAPHAAPTTSAAAPSTLRGVEHGVIPGTPMSMDWPGMSDLDSDEGDSS